MKLGTSGIEVYRNTAVGNECIGFFPEDQRYEIIWKYRDPTSQEQYTIITLVPATRFLGMTFRHPIPQREHIWINMR